LVPLLYLFINVFIIFVLTVMFHSPLLLLLVNVVSIFVIYYLFLFIMFY